MSEPSPGPEPTESPENVQPPLPEGGDRVLIALIAFNGLEPPASLSDQEALGAWCAVSSLWHPALLAQTSELPRIEDVETPSPPGRGEVRVIAAGAADRLPSGYRTQVEDAGAILLEGGTNREKLICEILERIDGGELPDLGDEDVKLARDFLALGTARWWLRDLTIAMGHADGLDVPSLTREVLSGANA